MKEGSPDQPNWSALCLQEECQNYIRVLLISGKTLFTCGTNAFTPVCITRQVSMAVWAARSGLSRVIQLSKWYKGLFFTEYLHIVVNLMPTCGWHSYLLINRDLVDSGKEKLPQKHCRKFVKMTNLIRSEGNISCFLHGVKQNSNERGVLASFNCQIGNTSHVLDTVNGVARCPYDPRHNSTAMVTQRGELYAATVIDFSGRDPVIYRSLGNMPPLRTAQYNSKWLNGKQSTPLICPSFSLNRVSFCEYHMLPVVFCHFLLF